MPHIKVCNYCIAAMPPAYDCAIMKVMVKAVEGVYRDGRVELEELIDEAEGSRVIVTWVQPVGSIDLRERGMSEPDATDLRRRLATFADDWEAPGMSVYDKLPSR